MERSTDDAHFTVIAALPGNATSYADVGPSCRTATIRQRPEVITTAFAPENGYYASAYSNYVNIQSKAQLGPGLVQAESYSGESSPGPSVGALGGATVIANCNAGQWVRYLVNVAPDVDMMLQITLRYQSLYASGNMIEIGEDSATNIVAAITTQYDPSGAFLTATVYAPGFNPGNHNIYFVFAGTNNGGLNIANVDWLQFEGMATTAINGVVQANQITATSGVTTVQRLDLRDHRLRHHQLRGGQLGGVRQCVFHAGHQPDFRELPIALRREQPPVPTGRHKQSGHRQRHDDQHRQRQLHHGDRVAQFHHGRAAHGLHYVRRHERHKHREHRLVRVHGHFDGGLRRPRWPRRWPPVRAST